MLEDGRIRMELTHFCCRCCCSSSMKEDENPKHKRKRLYKAKGESGGFIVLWKVEVYNSITFVLGTKAYFHHHARMLG